MFFTAIINLMHNVLANIFDAPAEPITRELAYNFDANPDKLKRTVNIIYA
jgi:hypothetical protein